MDQLEELFTLNPPETQDRFAALLGRLAREADVHVLLSLRDDLEVLSHSQGVDARGYVISGEVQNPGSPVMLAEIVATVYDVEGKVVGLGSHVFNPGALGQGQTAVFEIVVGVLCGEVANYELQVQGL